VASIELTEDGEVWGGVYRIEDGDRAELEKREGFKGCRHAAENSYIPDIVTVFDGGNSSRPIEALTFVANRHPYPPKPSGEYLQIILNGGKEWELDPGYIAELAKTKTLP
jgi:hypothetical protein